jgi:hypothetical protein
LTTKKRGRATKLRAGLQSFQLSAGHDVSGGRAALGEVEVAAGKFLFGLIAARLRQINEVEPPGSTYQRPRLPREQCLKSWPPTDVRSLPSTGLPSQSSVHKARASVSKRRGGAATEDRETGPSNGVRSGSNWAVGHSPSPMSYGSAQNSR